MTGAPTGPLVGWGTFDLVEGVIDHHLLGIHHVREGAYQLWWDLGFLAFAGGLYVLYLTPLYRATLAYPVLHGLVNLYFLVKGRAPH